MGYESHHRKKARELGAPEASALIATVPYLERILSETQVRQIQKVLDAAVVNPMYEQAYKQAMRASVISRAGGLVLRDRAKARRARRILDKRISVVKKDAYVRVDHTKMLTTDALMPHTNNPDEADYLAKVRQTLNSMGVWLRLAQPWEARGRDPRVWEFWFSLGPRGDTIETDDAIINREELLSTTMLGAGYYRSVLTGPVQTKIKRMISRFDTQYDNGWDLHAELLENRRQAAPGVAAISDLLGTADMPDMSIWKRPHKLRTKAWKENEAGDVIAAQVYLIIAAHAVEYNAELLADYSGRTVKGGERATKVLKVAKKAGEVAEFGLALTGVGYGVKAVRAAGGKAMSTEARYQVAEKLAYDFAKKNGVPKAELSSTPYVRMPKGTVLGNRKGAHSAGQGRGYHSYP